MISHVKYLETVRIEFSNEYHEIFKFHTEVSVQFGCALRYSMREQKMTINELQDVLTLRLTARHGICSGKSKYDTK